MFLSHYPSFFRTGFLILGLSAASVNAQMRILTPDPAARITAEARLSQDGPPGVRIVTPRNSGATGAVVLQNAQRPVEAQITELRHHAGGPAFPASLLQIRYGFNGMHDQPQSGSTQVIWITANVPHNAPPGDYTGRLQIPGGAAVPVRLEIGKWIAPRPSDYGVWQSYLHSPETISRHYNTTLWSDKHFEHMEPTLRMLGQLGNHVMYLNTTGRTHFGNEHTIIRWTGSGNNLQPEFSALETYFSLWDRHVGPPKVIIVYMQEAPWWRNTNETIRVTRVSRPGDAGGNVLELPHFSAEGQARLWRQAFAGLVQRVRAMGWDDTKILIGMVGDERSFPEAKEKFYNEAAPGIAWATFTHGRGDPRIPDDWETPHTLSGLDFRYVEFPYAPARGRGASFPADPLDREGQWRNSFPFLTSMRQTQYDNTGRVDNDQPMYWRYMALASAWAEYRGFGRIGFDFWSVDGPPLIGRFHRWNNLYRDNPRHLAQPGPDGALSTQVIEMAREGNTATEALRMIHDALTVSGQRSKVSGNLRREAQAAYMAYYEDFHKNWTRDRSGLHDDLARIVGTDWQTRLRTLYDTAGDVAAALGTAPAVSAPAAPAVPAAQPRPQPDRPAARPEIEGELRTWTSANGQTVEAAYLGYERGQVGLQLANGQRTAVAMSSLSDDDRAWVRNEAGFRQWRNREGVGVEALFIEFLGREITVEAPDGQRHNIPVDSLHPEDQDHLLNNLL
ncbi:MAG: hypothetical protein JJU05_13185 [Verrucomicrobia bacterium]|nr:hypothetical protein [Verrucomicrobiota bacterium]MCH8528945.1 hypothetical protein [Kiritimatiellia bacterium]